MPGIFSRKGIGNHPEAKLLALQSSFAVGDQRFEEIRSCLIKKTKVCSPGHVTDDVDSGLPHLGGHRGYLPMFVLAKRVPQAAFRTKTSYRRSCLLVFTQLVNSRIVWLYGSSVHWPRASVREGNFNLKTFRRFVNAEQCNAIGCPN